jgi:hypothetical protein
MSSVTLVIDEKMVQSINSVAGDIINILYTYDVNGS